MRFGGAAIVLVGGFGQVDLIPAGIFFVWPFAVVVDAGRYLQMAWDMRPGQEANWLVLMALIHVDGGGLNAHWCRNWMSLAFELAW